MIIKINFLEDEIECIFNICHFFNEHSQTNFNSEEIVNKGLNKDHWKNFLLSLKKQDTAQIATESGSVKVYDIKKLREKIEGMI